MRCLARRNALQVTAAEDHVDWDQAEGQIAWRRGMTLHAVLNAAATSRPPLLPAGHFSVGGGMRFDSFAELDTSLFQVGAYLGGS